MYGCFGSGVLALQKETECSFRPNLLTVSSANQGLLVLRNLSKEGHYLPSLSRMVRVTEIFNPLKNFFDCYYMNLK